MKHLTVLLLLTGILFSACGKKLATPSGGKDPDLTPEDLDPKNMPATLTLTNRSLYVKDNYLRGWIPYPLSKVVYNGYFKGDKWGQAYSFYNPEDPTFLIYSEYAMIALKTNDEQQWYNFSGYDDKYAPFGKGTEINNTSPYLEGVDISLFCMKYSIAEIEGNNPVDYDEESYNTFYQQTSPTSFTKIGYSVIAGDGKTITESWGKDCEGNSLQNKTKENLKVENTNGKHSHNLLHNFF